MRSSLKYIVEGFVIFGSIFLSFYIEDLRKENEDFITKNELVSDLILTLEDDLEQLKNLQEILLESERLILEILNDIDNSHTQLTNIDAINKILAIEVGFSFFPKDGIFNQLITTGSFELIKNNRLKTKLLEMYNHQKDRNYATSQEIDRFNIDFRGDIVKKFRIRFSYNSFDGKFYGSRSLTNFKFDKNYYLSNSFYGLISQGQLYVNMYMRQLKDIEESYKASYALAKEEIRNK